MSTITTDETTVETTSVSRRRRVRWHRVGIAGMAGGAALFSTGCTLSDVSTILSILRLLGIIA